MNEPAKPPPPLSAFAVWTLRALAQAPTPRQEINPGVARRLLRDQLVEEVLLPSPYKTRDGSVAHLRITVAGLAYLARCGA